MDKRSVLGFVLIGIVLMIWLYWNSSNQQKTVQNIKLKNDSVNVTENNKVIKDPVLTDSISGSSFSKEIADSLKSDSLVIQYGNIFGKLAIGSENSPSEKLIVIDNEKIQMEFSNYGGGLKKYTLKSYETWDKKPLQLIDWKQGKELHLLFTSKEGKLINTKDLVFESDYDEWKNVDLTSNSDFKLQYTLNITPDGSEKIVKTYTFYSDKYEFDVNYQFINSDKFVSGSKYQVVWESSLNLTEYRSDQEATFSEAFAYMGGELETLDATSKDEEYKADFNGNTDYVSTRNKYFGVFIIPDSRKGDGAFMSGFHETLKDNGSREHYSIAVKMDIKNDREDNSSFKILITPLDYNILKAYEMDLEKTLRFSLDFIVRPIAQYLILPVFLFLHSLIPSWGIVIILFAFLMKVVLNPLTKKQMDSMKKMSQLNPKITHIREKYKDDPVKANQQIMKLYKEEKINPAGGCLPMLLQLPILYALFGVFNSTIELRNESFLWIKDLSSPDVILNLPFKIPIFGISQISGLALAMGITMFIQQKMTITDPKQKAMVYIMPVMLTLLFFSFPAGLNLYYFMFNLFSITQQWWTNKKNPKPAVEVVTGNKIISNNSNTAKKKSLPGKK
ncbi:MAG: membrane protein insertase YidC [Ignavibacteria bacterium]|jgi:YidC/Oxa1 family membrane protein insertase|nr:membrane protein insertase YidC [Ignavibacteria bacterium]